MKRRPGYPGRFFVAQSLIAGTAASLVDLLEVADRGTAGAVVATSGLATDFFSLAMVAARLAGRARGNGTRLAPEGCRSPDDVSDAPR
jgi:hypothetical protein